MNLNNAIGLDHPVEVDDVFLLPNGLYVQVLDVKIDGTLIVNVTQERPSLIEDN